MSENTTTPSRRPLQPERKEGFLTRWLQQRYVLALMGFWCFFVLSALRLNLSLAIVAMVDWTAVKPEPNATHTEVGCRYEEGERPQKEDGPFAWNPALQGHILGSYFYGLAATQLLGGRLSELFSAKAVLLAGTAVATIATLLVPVAATQDGYWLVALQIAKGCGQGILMPSFSVLMGKWIPVVERARFMSFIASGMPVGAFLTVISSGFICRILGWPFVFYGFGAVGIAWCLCWFLLVYDSPLQHPRISKRELNRIMSSRSHRVSQLKVPMPVRAILSSRAVWAYVAVGFASFWCLSLYVSVVPLFMGTILKFDIEKNGILSAIPNLVETLFLIGTSLVSDHLLKKGTLSATTIRKTAISIGLLGYAVCMVAVTLTGCNRTWSVLFLVAALGMCGFNFASSAVVPVDMAPKFAGTISGIMNTFGATSGVIIPTMIGYLTKERQTLSEWSIAFYTTVGICVLAVILFVIFGSSEIQPWNSPPMPGPDVPVLREDSSSKQSFPMHDPSTSKEDTGLVSLREAEEDLRPGPPGKVEPASADSFIDNGEPMEVEQELTETASVDSFIVTGPVGEEEEEEPDNSLAVRPWRTSSFRRIDPDHEPSIVIFFP